MRRARSAITMITSALVAIGARMAPAQEKVLYSFGAQMDDGNSPYAAPIFDAKGNLYGTTGNGGDADEGTVFQLTPTADGAWTEKTLYRFGATNVDGLWPEAVLIFDAKGNLYGTTIGGGDHGNGTVFELLPKGDGAWAEKTLYSFGASSTDGMTPTGGLVFDAKGNLYGTTFSIRAYTNGDNVGGTVFELTPETDGAWTEKVLYRFGATSKDGNGPESGVISDAKGNLYGTTYYGGANGGGTAFELSPAADGSWKEKLLYSFGATSLDGAAPDAGLIFDSKGNLYGTTEFGGAYYVPYNRDPGTVFELAPAPGGDWTKKLLHSFCATNPPGYYCTDGEGPGSDLAIDAAGNLYGTTEFGGVHGIGTGFELTPTSGGAWTEKVLHDFSGGSRDGAAPVAGLTLDGTGNLYGAAFSGGTHAGGTVFEIASTTTAQSPQFSPGPGAYIARQTVKITDRTAGAIIHFTSNGDTPTLSSLEYKEPIEVSESETIKAIAEGDGLRNSAVATATYEIGEPAAKPVFSEPGATYKSAQSITITDETPDSTIYYTTNEKTPTSSSTKFTKPIEVSASETIEAIAVAKGYKPSEITSVTYTIHLPSAPAPTLTPVAGTVPSGQIVKIADKVTKGLIIYYTTNGKTPSTSSTKYTSAGIKVTATETIKVIAIATGYSQSAVASAKYTVN
jgi:uncharacterized repeat protein (TIGR03803 family)